ncbi:MAG: NUDIX hydrolase [Bacteroidales bacterium]|jgi:ADP-ribose pyrophosphatase|nr:NUDIX hydrolase [Bacteroidales bacterium]
MEQLKKWDVLSSEYLFKEPWFTVRRETVALPNGNRIPAYYVLEYPEWVNVIAITRDSQFVFVRQYRHALGCTCYELCAGVCEASDPSPMHAAKRELLEETGYGNGVWEKYAELSPNPSTMTNLSHSFIARDVEIVSAPHPEATEDLSVHLLSLEQVRALLETDQIKQSLMAAVLWKYIAHL